MELEKFLNEYKQITLKAIDSIHEEQLDKLLNLIDTRGKIIIKIKSLEYDKKVFIELVNKLDLIIIDEELSKYINNKKSEMKKKIQMLDTGKKVNANYGVYQKKALFFSKKI